jgi:hypothetical protein
MARTNTAIHPETSGHPTNPTADVKRIDIRVGSVAS